MLTAVFPNDVAEAPEAPLDVIPLTLETPKLQTLP